MGEIVKGEELIKRIVKALNDLERDNKYIRLNEAHDFVGNACTWECYECPFDTDTKNGCKMADYLDNLYTYTPIMERDSKGIFYPSADMRGKE